MNKWKIAVGILLCSHSVFGQENVTIYAASSMTNAVNDMVSAFNKQHDVNVTTVFGSSSSLARQIENGAPADVYLSANEKWVSYLIDKNVVEREKVSLIAGNQLALITPRDSTLTPFDIHDKHQWQTILKEARMAVGNTNAVPVGIYSKQALVNLKVWDTVESKLAQAKNVRAALALVERAESPLGIVYKTDAMLTKNVSTLTLLDPDLYGTIHYPLVQLSDNESSSELVEFIKSSQAKSVLNHYGFRTDMGNEKFAQ